MKKKDGDALYAVVVLAAVAVLALTAWAGGRRLYARWKAGGARPPAVQKPAPLGDGYDRPPPVIPPLAMVGITPSAKPPRERPKPPAALPMPPITPDRE